MKLKNILLICLVVLILGFVGIFIVDKIYILPQNTVWQLCIAAGIVYFLILIVMVILAGIVRNERLKKEKREEHKFEGISVQYDNDNYNYNNDPIVQRINDWHK